MDLLDVFHPNLAIVFDCVDIVVLNIGDVFYLPADDNVLVLDHRSHRPTTDGERNEAAASDTGDREKMIVLRRIGTERGTGKRANRSEQNIARTVGHRAFGAEELVACIEAERVSDPVEHPGFVDAKNAAKGLSLWL